MDKEESNGIMKFENANKLRFDQSWTTSDNPTPKFQFSCTKRIKMRHEADTMQTLYIIIQIEYFI